MLSSPLRFIAISLLALAACGGQTVGIGPTQTGDPTGPGRADAADDSGATADDASTLPPSSADAGSTPPVADAATGATCLTSADCPSGTQCAWPVTEDACIAFNPAGSCVRPLELACDAVVGVTGCGCDGKDVQWTTGCVGLPAGWAPVGLAHGGSCDAAVADAGTATVVGCATDADCGEATPICAYPVHGGCDAVPTCVSAISLSGDCNMAPMPGCACDGATVAIQCGETASPVPIAHTGACAGDDGGF